MSIVDFIFSEKRNDRIKQHLLFWAAWYLYIILTHAANPLGQPEISYFRNPVFTFTESFFTVFAQVPIVYSMLYFVFPKFILKKKYFVSFVWMMLLWFMCGAFTLILLDKVMQPFLAMLLPPENIPTIPKIPGTSFFEAVMATNKGAYTIIASSLMLKFGKYWYHHQHRSLQLQKENTEAQLQLLTAQVHPHFLFNTLNNIFSKTQTESPGGSKMIMSLSDMLRYILYEGRKLLVPLKQELAMITEYINLEKIRYGNKLDVHVLTPHKSDDLYIAPLLLLPFVENCFKHGASNMLQNPWINLTVEVKDTTLVMKLMNGKTALKVNGHSTQGIGIKNVQQRLDLLYKDRYDLQIHEEDEVFVVDLRLELTRVKGTKETIAQLKTETDHV
ncbi:sensor histidine kinase [Lacibacter sediminis]|uniref:Histidine kinase n=1 Tax=Lacibacter sediminis TaxID=2760713 RepID=A0A7G5XIX3_9BACT|nr:histidine kinase [Lacibacter sediminis]QNA45426.1 histidine kinase [Lacibacter sediminis]